MSVPAVGFSHVIAVSLSGYVGKAAVECLDQPLVESGFAASDSGNTIIGWMAIPPVDDVAWIDPEIEMPANESPGTWSQRIIALMQSGDIYHLSSQGDYWQRLRKTRPGDKVVRWMPVPQTIG